MVPFEVCQSGSGPIRGGSVHALTSVADKFVLPIKIILMPWQLAIFLYLKLVFEFYLLTTLPDKNTLTSIKRNRIILNWVPDHFSLIFISDCND